MSIIAAETSEGVMRVFHYGASALEWVDTGGPYLRIDFDGCQDEGWLKTRFYREKVFGRKRKHSKFNYSWVKIKLIQ